MSDKTYSETQGVPSFDWWKALNNPESHGTYNMAMRAKSWVTCACGNQCAIIPRHEGQRSMFWMDGEPLDVKLSDLGVEFYGAVSSGLFEDAKGVLREIEARSAVLIAEQLQTLSTPNP